MSKIETVLSRFWDPNNWLGVVFYAAVFLVIAIVVSRVIRAATMRFLVREENALVDRTVALFLMQFAQFGVYVLTLIVFFHVVPVLNKLGTALLTGVSVASVVFGLAAQNTLSNLVAGCTLLLYRPFHIDDFIQVATPTGTEMGVIERLTLGYTMLRTVDNRLVIVPNSLMASQVSLNLNRRSLYAMANVPVGVSDIQHVGEVRGVLMEIARKNPKIHRVFSCQMQALDDGSAVLSLRAWCANSALAGEAQQEIGEAVKRHFASRNIVFLTPTASAPPPAPPSAASAHS